MYLSHRSFNNSRVQRLGTWWSTRKRRIFDENQSDFSEKLRKGQFSKIDFGLNAAAKPVWTVTSAFFLEPPNKNESFQQDLRVRSLTRRLMILEISEFRYIFAVGGGGGVSLIISNHKRFVTPAR